MPELSDVLHNGAGHVWLLIPSAVLLGALHGLEPGHSKTMIAAFIIAIHGTVTQAVQLGVSAAFSHTAVVWIVALVGLSYGTRFNAEASEPYFEIASAAAIVAIALWMLWRSWRDLNGGHTPDHHDHHHDHSHAAGASAPVDAHALAHARDIETRFKSGSATTGQIIMFGLTGGLIPCPAAITVLLLCLQLRHISLGATLVGAFSLGLAITMVGAGVLAALSLKHVSARWSGLSHYLPYAPLVSSMLVLLMGLYLGHLGWSQLA